MVRTTPTDRLLAVLSDIEGALLDGDFDSLPALAKKQTQLTHDISLMRDRAAKPALVAIGSAADRNQRLLAAALRGMKSASQRRAEVTTPRQPTRTYDRNGHTSLIAGADPKIEHRR